MGQYYLRVTFFALHYATMLFLHHNQPRSVALFYSVFVSLLLQLCSLSCSFFSPQELISTTNDMSDQVMQFEFVNFHFYLSVHITIIIM